MTRKERILNKLEDAQGLQYMGVDYFITCRDIEVEDLPEDVEPSVSVILPYTGADGMWLEHDLYLDELLDDPNLKLYTLCELSIGES
jgi:hypothetical protein